MKTNVITVAAIYVLGMLNMVNAADRNWQQSTDTQTKLWVRDKNEGRPYEVTFKVTEPNDSSVVLKARSGDGGVAEVIFPQSFGIAGPLLPSGKYHWSAYVDGKLIASDGFGR